MKGIYLVLFCLNSILIVCQIDVKINIGITVKSETWDYSTRFNSAVGKPDLTLQVYVGNKLYDTYNHIDNSNSFGYSKSIKANPLDTIKIVVIDRDDGVLNSLNNYDIIGRFNFTIKDGKTDFSISNDYGNFDVRGIVKFKKSYVLKIKSIDFEMLYDRSDKKIKKRDLKKMELSISYQRQTVCSFKFEDLDVEKMKVKINKDVAFSCYNETSFYEDNIEVNVTNYKTKKFLGFSFILSENEKGEILINVKNDTNKKTNLPIFFEIEKAVNLSSR